MPLRPATGRAGTTAERWVARHDFARQENTRAQSIKNMSCKVVFRDFSANMMKIKCVDMFFNIVLRSKTSTFYIIWLFLCKYSVSNMDKKRRWYF